MERKTRQRESILETFKSSPGPLSPQEVLDQTKPRLPEIGIATVYRNIKNFVEIGTLHVVPIPGEPDRYELAGKKHHHHFFCRTCHKAFEMEGCPGSLSQLAPEGFKVDQHEIYLYGQCRDCLAKPG
ncbi:MAG TPA: transcriptional repressor [Kiritimatiellia bacterium]|nr:transcriptional repressor [Kiritimatiellia bacterium]